VKQLRLGATDLLVSEIGFGCARVGGFFQSGEQQEVVRTLHAAYDRGITFFDTSDMYAQGESEALLGSAFRELGPAVTIATKVGYTLPSQRTLLARAKPLLRPLIRATGLKRGQVPHFARGSIAQDFSPRHIIRSAEGSLRRLRRDFLDLYQLHSPPPEVLRSGDFMEPLERLKSAGKIRWYGVSCENAADAQLALRHRGVSTVQVRLSLLAQEALVAALPLAAARNVGVVARECFAGGLLIKPIQASGSDALAPPADHGSSEAPEIGGYSRLAAAMGRTLPECALQFVRATTGISVTLLGMRNERHLAFNLALLAAPSLTTSELSDLRTQYELEHSTEGRGR